MSNRCSTPNLAVSSIAFALIFSVSSSLWGSTIGKVVGQVVDGATNEPLPGVNVLLEGTTVGAATDNQGRYFILNVPVGTYRLTASMIGFTILTKTDVLVTLGRITNVDFSLQSTVIAGEAVTVVAERAIIHREVSNSQQVVTSEQILEAPVMRNLGDFLRKQVGVGDDLGIRGSDPYETGMVINGLTIIDERAGQPQSTIPLSAIDQVALLSGGFNAEYGDFRSGIINVKTKTGSRDRYEGRIDVSSNIPHQKRFGLSIYDPYNSLTRPYFDPDVAFIGTKAAWAEDEYTQQQHPAFSGWNKVAEGYNKEKDPDKHMTPLEIYLWNAWMHMIEPPFDKLEELGYEVSDELKAKMRDHAHEPEGQHADYNVDFGFGGPVPLIGKFLGDATFFLSSNFNTGYYTQPVTIDAQNLQSTLLTLSFNPTSSLKLDLTGYYRHQYGARAGRGGGGEVMQQIDNVNHFAGFGKTYHWYQTHFHTMHKYTSMVGITLNNVVSPRTYWMLNLNTVRDQGRVPSNADAFVRDTTLQARFGPEVAVTEMPYNYGPGYEEVGGYKYGMYDQPYGLGRRYANKAGEGEQKSDTRVYRLKFDLSSQINFNHQLSAGASIKYSTFEHEMYWVRPFKNETARNYTWGDNTPLNAGVYFQDQISHEGMVANIGVRADYYAPGGVWPHGNEYNFDIYGTIAPPTPDVIENSQLEPIWETWEAFDSTHSGFLRPVDSHFAISPRIGLSFPVTERTKFYFNYGHFRATPPVQEMYYIDRRPYRVGFTSMGNPNLEPPRTISYETGVEYNLLDQYHLRIAGYYKDITGDPGDIGYTSNDGRVKWDTYESNRYRDIHGLEISITKSLGKYIRGWVNYDYMITKRGLTGVDEQYEDPSKTELMGRYEAQETRPLPRPKFRANITLNTPDHLGPFNILGGWSINLLPQWRAGGYFTWNPLGKFHLSDNLQWPSYSRTDARLMRTFSVGGGKIEVYVDAQNVFNNKASNLSSDEVFYSGTDEKEYLRTLHLPMYDSEEFDVLREQNPGKYIAGDDKVGDMRSSEKDYINDPNLMDLWGFKQPRDIWFGIRIRF